MLLHAPWCGAAPPSPRENLAVFPAASRGGTPFPRDYISKKPKAAKNRVLRALKRGFNPVGGSCSRTAVVNVKRYPRSCERKRGGAKAPVAARKRCNYFEAQPLFLASKPFLDLKLGYLPPSIGRLKLR